MRYWCAVLLFIFLQQNIYGQTVKSTDTTHSSTVSNMLSGNGDKPTSVLMHQQAIVSNNLPFEKNEIFTIADVVITGNKKTKGYIIIRETTFKKGDNISAADLAKKLIESKQLIYNTGLFVDDSVYISQRKGNTVFINIDVKERWYFFPLPYFVLVDRNFNQWWVQENRSLERVNYGIKFTQNNFSGQDDNLNIWLINGYNQQITLRYGLPFIDKKLTQGFNVGFTYSRQRELNYATSSNNKQLFYDQPDGFAKNIARFDLTYSFRPDQRIRHLFRIAYTSESVSDSIIKLNPLYYPNSLNNIKYLDFTYSFRYYNNDYNAYPTKGVFGEAYIYKRGLDNITNLWQVGVHGLYAKPILPKTFFRIEGALSVKFPSTNYFINQPLFGYGYYTLRGMEYYVVDGTTGALGKFTLYRELFKYIYKTPFHTKTHDKIPFRVYMKAYSDVGYSYSPGINNNLFNNKLMYTWGAGFDVVSIYDLVFRFEYSFNQLGENGLYLHASSGF